MVTAKADPATKQYRLVGSKTAFVEEANRYLEFLAARGLSPLTIRSYAFAIIRFQRWFVSRDIEFEELEEFKKLHQMDLVPYIAELRRDNAHPTTINHRLTVVRLLFFFVTGQTMKWGAGAYRPHPGSRYRGVYEQRLGLHWIRMHQSDILRVKTPQKLFESLTAKQIELLFKSFHRYRDGALIQLMVLCGLRSREVLAIRLNDIDAAAHRLRVHGKGQKQRWVPLPALVEETLLRYLNLERPQPCHTVQLFVVLQGRRRGQPMTPEGLRSLFRCRRRDAKLRHANPHKLRHAFGVDMARAGVSLAVLQRLMGHAYPDTTMRYINLSMRDIHEAYEQAMKVLAKRRLS